jgi:ribosome-binding factor A
MSRQPPSEPSQRQLRVGEQIRHIIAETLLRGHFSSETLLDASRVTVTEVKIAPDLKNATAFVLALGGKEMGSILAALNDEAQVFQKEVARKAALKFTPKIRFVYDESFGKAQRIDMLLHEISKDTKK